MGLDPNKWFNNVEIAVSKDIGTRDRHVRSQHLQVLRDVRVGEHADTNKSSRSKPRSRSLDSEGSGCDDRTYAVSEGRRSNHGCARSSCDASCSSSSSSPKRPTNWTPIGRLSAFQYSGSEIAGCPVAFCRFVNPQKFENRLRERHSIRTHRVEPAERDRRRHERRRQHHIVGLVEARYGAAGLMNRLYRRRVALRRNAAPYSTVARVFSSMSSSRRRATEHGQARIDEVRDAR